MSNFSTIVLE